MAARARPPFVLNCAARCSAGFPEVASSRSGLFSGGGKITAGDIAIFSRQLATMLTAGIPLVQAFEIVGNGHDNPGNAEARAGHQGRRRGRQLAG